MAIADLLLRHLYFVFHLLFFSEKTMNDKFFLFAHPISSYKFKQFGNKTQVLFKNFFAAFMRKMW